ncbi:hypothetical protein PMAYCL1PPCAC_00932, partial [Pristionchus mayeri]
SSMNVEARVTFEKSEVLDTADLRGELNVASFRCSEGCRVFSPSLTNAIGVYDESGFEKLTLEDLSRGTYNNRGFELPGGTYQLKKGNRSPTLPDLSFVFYVVEKGAENYGSEVYYLNSDDKFLIETPKTMTILSTTGAVTFSSFLLFTPESLPNVYAAGYDSIRNCRAV